MSHIAHIACNLCPGHSLERLHDSARARPDVDASAIHTTFQNDMRDLSYIRPCSGCRTEYEERRSSSQVDPDSANQLCCCLVSLHFLRHLMLEHSSKSSTSYLLDAKGLLKIPHQQGVLVSVQPPPEPIHVVFERTRSMNPI